MDINELLEAIGAEDWEAGYFGDTVICPCGDEIELDGRCPEGHVSPLRSAGII